MRLFISALHDGKEWKHKNTIIKSAKVLLDFMLHKQAVMELLPANAHYIQQNKCGIDRYLNRQWGWQDLF